MQVADPSQLSAFSTFGLAYLSLAVRLQVGGLLIWGLYRLSLGRKAGPSSQRLLLMLVAVRFAVDLLTALLEFWPPIPCANWAAKSRLLGISLAFPQGKLGLDLLSLWVRLDEVKANAGTLLVGALGSGLASRLGYLLLLWGIFCGVRFVVGSLRYVADIRGNCQWSDQHGVLVSPDYPSMAIGWLHPVPVISQEDLLRSPQERRAIVLHEVGHCQRFDPLLSWALELLHCCFPFLWSWRWCTRAIRQQMELAADRWAVQQGACSVSLAKVLVAQQGAAAPHWGTASCGSPLFQRIELLLGSAPERTPTVVGALIWGLLILGTRVL